MIGENGIRFFGLDRDRLATIAKRIGPKIEEIIGGPSMTEDQLERFSASSGYLKPYEGDERLAAVDELLKDDLALLGATL
jgi:hypothetical protein